MKKKQNNTGWILIADFQHRISEINSVMDEPQHDKEKNVWAVSFAVNSLFHTSYFLTEAEAVVTIRRIKEAVFFLKEKNNERCDS